MLVHASSFGQALAVSGVLSALAAIPAYGLPSDEYLRKPELVVATECPPHDSGYLHKGYFATCYRKDWKIARWVAYHLTARDLEGDVDRTDGFRVDRELHVPDPVQPSDYAGSGYHRCHMAPAETFDGSVHTISTTFLMTNITPQTPALDLGKWKSLESEVCKVVEADIIWPCNYGVHLPDAHVRDTDGP